MKKFIIITTINKKTKAIKEFSKILKDWHIILVGDKKSRYIKSYKNITFLSIQDQEKLPFKTAKLCPYNHYARKNIGYLYAIKNGADIIYDTDDDNIPYNNWKFPTFTKDSKIISSKEGYINIYNNFTSEKIWPRGYPLEKINKIQTPKIKKSKDIKIGAWQGLADLDPDVDAIYRLLINKNIIFKKKSPIVLNKKTYCPFNSQNTLWNKECFPYMYLPASVSFRFTDILRGYIAQKLFWEDNFMLGFTKATVYQERNKHNLMSDFASELDCYLHINNIVGIMNKQKLTQDKFKNLEIIYKALLSNGYVEKLELQTLKAWTSDINNIYKENKNG